MRIMNITDGYPPDRGGREFAISALTTLRASQGHEVTVLTVSHPERPTVEWRGGVRVVRRPMALQKLPVYDTNHAFHPTAPDPLFQKAVRDAIQTFEPEIIHVHDWSLYSAIGPATAAGIPVVASVHDYGHLCAKKTLMLADGSLCSGPSWSKCLPCSASHYGVVRGLPLATGLLSSQRKNLRVAHWLPISQHVATQGIAMGYPSGPMTVIPSFVDDRDLPTRRPKRPGFAPSGPYLMFAGQLTAHKGVDVLIEAYRRVREQLAADGVRAPALLLVGLTLQGSVDTDGEGIQVVTNLDHAEVMAGWAHATIGIAPSAWAEPFGKVAVEAGLMGVPVVASASGGFLDSVINGHTGLLVEPRSPSALADALLDLLRNPARARAMGKRAATYSRRYLLSNVAVDLMGVMEGVLAERAERDAFSN